MDNNFYCSQERTRVLIGAEGVNKLANSSVVIFGLGGVGGQLTEALARAGIGKFLLVDYDRISLSNINRQIFALRSTVGRLKTEVAKERILDINPLAQVFTAELFVDESNINQLDFSPYDFVADAVDTVAAKIAIIQKAKAENKQIITCMGAGNRLNANFLCADIHSTHGCPLAKKMRNCLKKCNIINVKAVFSPFCMDLKQANTPQESSGNQNKFISDNNDMLTYASAVDTDNQKDISADMHTKKVVIGSISFVPPAAGLTMAGEIIKTIIGLT